MSIPSSPLSPKQQEFLDLLTAKRPEQEYQSFLEENTEFIPREFVQNHGIRNGVVISKLKLGSEMVTDFVYLSASTISFNIVLIELEKPQSHFFKPGELEIHNDFRAGLDQIRKWRAWMDVQANVDHLTSQKLEPLISPHNRRKVYIKYLLVFGRRSECEGNAERERLLRANQQDDFKIITYDSLLDHPKQEKLYVAKRMGDHFEITSKRYIDDTVFAWVAADQLRISPELRADALACQSQWLSNTVHNGQTVKSMDKALSLVKNA